MYCSNCGKEIEDQAKFCPNCGFNVGEDENLNKKNSINGSFFKETLIKSLNLIKNFLISPIDNLHKVTLELEKEVSICISIITCILFGFIFYFNEKVFLYSLNDGEILFRDINSLNESIGLTASRLFFNGILIFIFSVLFIFLISDLLSHYMFKSNVDNFKLFSAIIFSFIPFCACLLLGSIFGFINYIFMLIFIILGLMLLIISLFQTMKKICKFNTNISTYVASLNMLIFVLINRGVNNSIVNTVFGNLINKILNGLIY